MSSASIRQGSAALLFASGVLLLVGLGSQRGAIGSYLPHGYCFTWNPPLLWTHVVSDSVIALAYVSIPLTLVHLVRKRTDTPFNWIVFLFALFILSCGATHAVEVWTVWHPDYWLSANVKVVTAIASVLTASVLVYLVPRILAIPTTSELTAAKNALEIEIRVRRQAEDALLQERTELEQRVLERTAELARATELAKAARAEAEAANRQKDQFLAKVSHELRTPLQATLSWANLLKLRAGDRERSELAAERIMHSARAQAKLIDDLLDISRILSGKLRFEMQDADPIEVVDRAVEMVRSTAAQKEIGIDVIGGADGMRMMTDPNRLEQVIWNLVSNAVHASSKGGRVQVSVRCDATTLVLEIRDWGKGIDGDDLKVIFEPFRQGSRTESQHRGLGLGLAITRNIVHLFAGEITARSEGPQRGACFTVSLPLRQEASIPTSGSDVILSASETASLRGLRVLYVEDEIDIADATRMILETLDLEVTQCMTFDAARRGIDTGDFDVFLFDLRLDDGHTGFELLEHARRQERSERVPAVVLSAFGSDDDRQHSLAAGFAAHLVKPMSAEAVIRSLLAAVGRANT